MTPAIVNHLWQSTVIVIAAALVALALRRNQARTRHAVWLAASLKFLLPFSLLISLGGALTWRTAEAPVTIAPTIVETVQTMTEPFAASSAGPAQTTAEQTPTAIPWSARLASVWMLGTLVVLAIRLRGWLSVLALLRTSAPATLCDVEVGLNLRAAPGLLEPGVVGILRPVLLVPVGLESTLSSDQLRAVVAHELHHIQRRDNLTSTLHMIVEALFWFHPLVWWVGARLIDERERACDEYVLASGAAAEAYAEGILNVCKRYVESPVACVSGVTGSDLKKRIGAILAGRVGVRLTIARRVLLVASVLVGMGLPIAVGAIGASLHTVPPEGARDAIRPNSLSAPPTGQRFDVASVRPCDPSTIPTGRAGGRGAGAGSPTTNSDEKATASSGRLYLHCETLWRLVQQAYLGRESLHAPIAGGPSWVGTDPFDIEAAASSDTPEAALRGPLLQRLLEERFHLQIHREARSRPVYALRPAKAGFKLAALSDGMCLPIAGVPPGKARCGTLSVRYGAEERLIDVNGQTISGLAEVLENYAPLDRPVIDMTSISGVFDFHLRFGTAGPPEQMLAAAIQPQIGLALDATTGPAEFLIIDHVEKPDFAGAEAPATSRQAPSTSTQAPATSTQTPTPAAPQKFDVASIRPCDNTPSVPGGRGGGGPVFSPGLFVFNCGTLEQLINEAYVNNGDALLNDEGRVAIAGSNLRDPKNFPDRIRNGPDWLRTERFMIEAKTPVSTGASGRGAVPERATLMGPMLRAFLEDRFELKLHRDAQSDVPMYALTVAKDGLKLKPAGPDSCTPGDPNVVYRMRDEAETVRNGGKPICGHGIMSGDRGPNKVLVLNGLTMEGAAHWLSGVMDRHVMDRTGVSDKFIIYLEYAPDDQVPYDFKAPGATTDPPTAPTMAQALKALGLELQPTKGPKGYIVIDHVERPKIDGSAKPLARARGGK